MKERTERRSIPDFLKPEDKGEKLTPKQVARVIGEVLQPVRAKYGGQGFAKPSAFINGAAPDFKEQLGELFDEHVEGFSGKSFRKMGKKQEQMNMLWKQRLKAKAEADGTIVKARDRGGRSPGRRRRRRRRGRKDPRARWRELEKEREGDRARCDGGGGGGGGSARRRGPGAQAAARPQAANQGGSDGDDAGGLPGVDAAGRVKVADHDARNSAIEAYRAMQKAKLQKANPRGRR